MTCRSEQQGSRQHSSMIVFPPRRLPREQSIVQPPRRRASRRLESFRNGRGSQPGSLRGTVQAQRNCPEQLLRACCSVTSEKLAEAFARRRARGTKATGPLGGFSLDPPGRLTQPACPEGDRKTSLGNTPGKIGAEGVPSFALSAVWLRCRRPRRRIFRGAPPKHGLPPREPSDRPLERRPRRPWPAPGRAGTG